MNASARNVRKAAIVLASLDAEHADALLRQMSPAQAHVLRQAVQELGTMDSVEQGGVIEEFFRVGPLPISLGGVPAEASTKAAGDESNAFRFLEDAPAERLVLFLEREHPQTIAVVLSQLAADRAAEVLAHLKGALQTDVARRLVYLEETDPEILRDVERGLEAWLATQAGGRRGSAAGVAALANILGAANPQARHQILSNLARYDRQLAERVDQPRTPAFRFVDLESMDSPSLSIVLHHADHQLLATALSGAGPLFVERALELLGPGGTAVRRTLASMPPVPRVEIDDAQQRLADLARQLDQRGEINPDVRARLSLAV